MLEAEVVDRARAQAEIHEANLPKGQRKQLGQFFTGMKLGRILAHLAVEDDTRSILDPMAGSGDLLDTAAEAAASRGVSLERLDGMEIDPSTANRCIQRLENTTSDLVSRSEIICGNAFKEAISPRMAEAYDLVITNPPFVRYQSLTGQIPQIRNDLRACVEARVDTAVRNLWLAMADAYSGLADLSVPSWILSASLVRPGGRLAIVVPATWRTRSYADVIRYMLIRCFTVEAVVEDHQPGWFSDALVRSHLIVARRLPPEEECVPLRKRANWRSNPWVNISPLAASEDSLVGKAFSSERPEHDVARWVYSLEYGDNRPGINTQAFSHQEEWSSILGKFGQKPWLRKLEGLGGKTIKAHATSPAGTPIPAALTRIMPHTVNKAALANLEEVGIKVGQGLRSGCNRFFYVERVSNDSGGKILVRTGSAYGNNTLAVPSDALRAVLHRQADISSLLSGMPLRAFALDLRNWVLPEDKAADDLRQVIPDQMARHIRRAAKTPLGSASNSKAAPELTAVRTNIRAARDGFPARYWYMLPDFAARHQPQAFVARIAHDSPRVHPNTIHPTLIDANFSTFWEENGMIGNEALTAFLNSSWCRAAMEAIGTPLGGGALKLEAAHLRSMPVPKLPSGDWARLQELSKMTNDTERQLLINRLVLRPIFPAIIGDEDLDGFSVNLDKMVARLVSSRRSASA
ncbi:N-6 DNA methylase [Epibacterium ulvae]|uniref:N-6 DNA methylase n=1 Tax=Epibacterium ulvae TaxID=1156985 RepID=UPI002492C870|nr:N-6 DNA methylase [Epibacterium ulvae]